MNIKEKNKLLMYKTVKTVLSGNAASWSALPVFQNVYDAFTDKLALLESFAYSQAFAALGAGTVKREKRKEVAAIAIPLAKALKAYAAIIGDMELREKVKFPPSEMLHASGQSTLTLIDFIIEKSTDHLAALADYGITQQQVDELANEREDLYLMLGAPRTAILDRKQMTATIAQLIREIDQILREQIDMLVGTLQLTDPKFASLYSNARAIVDLKSKKHPDKGKERDDGEIPHAS